MEVTIKGHVVLFDEEDVELFESRSWHIARKKKWLYVEARDGLNFYSLHRSILGLSPGDGRIADHINGNGLDNRRRNLRVCTHAENMRNSAKRSSNKCGFKGVYRATNPMLWRSQIRHNGIKYHLGQFDSREAAHAAYAEAAARLHGAFARAE